MQIKDNLTSLEILRGFVEKHVSRESYVLNMLIDGREVMNFRLWALRGVLGIDEITFADEMNIDVRKYHEFERRGKQIPVDFLQKVAEKYNIPINWLLCKQLMLPIPMPKKPQTASKK
jgi:hypothetical protein